MLPARQASIVERQRMGPRRRGAALLEAALVLSFCLYFMLGIVEYGRLLMTRQLLENAAREAARLAIAGSDRLTGQDIQNSVIARMGGQSLTNMTVQVYKADPTSGANIGVWTDAGSGDCIAVEINGSYRPIVPRITLLPNPLAMRAKAVLFSEAN
jgi:Flp pilus assembly protein TadG